MKAAFTCALCHSRDVPRSKRKRDLCEDCEPGLAVRGLAWCTKGKHRAQAADMVAITSNRPWCKACKARSRRDYYAADPERARARVRHYYHKNRDKRIAKKREWRATHKEYISAYHRARYAANAEHFRAYARAYWQEHRERIKQRHREWYATNKDLQPSAHIRRKLKILQSWRRAV